MPINATNTGFDTTESPKRGRVLAGAADLYAQIFSGILEWWRGKPQAADIEVGKEKTTTDFRAWDSYENQPAIAAAVAVLEEATVGTSYLLNSVVDYEALGLTEKWNDRFQSEVERKFMTWAMSTSNWVDSSRKTNFIGLLRQCLRNYILYGEVLIMSLPAGKNSPYTTSFSVIDTNRITQPLISDKLPDNVTDINGLRVNKTTGEILGVWLCEPKDSPKAMQDTAPGYVPCQTAWGRKIALYYGDWRKAGQTRGISGIKAILKLAHTLEHLNLINVSRATIDASFYATIESDLPSGLVLNGFEGAQGANSIQGAITNQMTAYAAAQDGVTIENADGTKTHIKGAEPVKVGGVTIPTLPTGTHLNLHNTTKNSTPGSDFTRSLLSGVASVCGVSYEEISNDYTNTNYSSAKASGVKTYRQALRLRMFAINPCANLIFQNWLEEAIVRGDIPSMKEKGVPSFWEPGNRELFSQSNWVGQGKVSLDELKDAQSDTLRLTGGIATFETIFAEKGKEWRSELKQFKREGDFLKSIGLTREEVLGRQQTDMMNAVRGTPREPDNAKVE